MRQPGVLLQLQHKKDQGGLASSWKLGTMKKVFPDHLAYVPRCPMPCLTLMNNPAVPDGSRIYFCLSPLPPRGPREQEPCWAPPCPSSCSHAVHIRGAQKLLNEEGCGLSLGESCVFVKNSQ